MSFIKSKGYREEQARRTLHHICRFTLDDWICCDAPDLQNHTDSYGIEVVQDVDEDNQEMLRFMEEIYQKPSSQVDPRKIRTFESKGGTAQIKDGIFADISARKMENNPEHLLETITDKIDMLNNGSYASFARYDLYVFVQTVYIAESFDSYIQQVIDEAYKYQEHLSRKYNMLYLDQDYILCVCDLEKKSFLRKPISARIQELIHQETKEKWQN